MFRGSLQLFPRPLESFVQPVQLARCRHPHLAKGRIDPLLSFVILPLAEVEFLLANVSPALALLGDPFSFVGRSLASVGSLLALIRDAFPLIGSAYALIGQPLVLFDGLSTLSQGLLAALEGSLRRAVISSGRVAPRHQLRT